MLGLGGHDPWKNRDAWGFGLVWGKYLGENWGANWAHIPDYVYHIWGDNTSIYPLWVLVGAVGVAVLGLVFPPFDAARYMSGLWMLGACWFLYQATDHLFQRYKSRNSNQSLYQLLTPPRLAVLIFLSSLGLVEKIHEISEAPALLFWLSFYCWGWLRPTPPGYPHSKIWLLGIALGGLGWTAGSVVYPCLLMWMALPYLYPEEWGTQKTIHWWICTLILIMGLGGFGLLSPGLIDGFLEGTGSLEISLIQGGITLIWFAFPAWLIIFAWIFRQGWHGSKKRLYALPLIPSVLGLLFLILALLSMRDAKEQFLLALLLPMSLVSVSVAPQVGRDVSSLLDWLGRVCFGALIGLVWLSYIALQTGWPDWLSVALATRESGLTAIPVHPLLLVIAVFMTGIWLFIVQEMDWNFVLRGLVSWALGLLCFWVVLVLLLFPWINAGKSYKRVADTIYQTLQQYEHGNADLSDAKSPRRSCIAAYHLSHAEWVSFQFFTDTKILIVNPNQSLYSSSHYQKWSCPWVLIQGKQNETSLPLPNGILRWQGHRTGDRVQHFWLWQIIPSSHTALASLGKEK